MESDNLQSAPKEFYDATKDTAQKARQSSGRPTAVVLASVLLIAGALLHMIVAIFLLPLLSNPSISKTILSLLTVVIILKLVLGSLFIVAAIGMLMMKSWARKLGIGLAIFGFVLWTVSSGFSGLIDLVYYFIVLALLMKTDVRMAFN